MTEVLTIITWSVVGLVVLLLVFYLTGTFLALYRAGNHLSELNRLLKAVGDNTEPFAERVDTVNGALTELRDVLVAVNGELQGIVELFRRQK